jgi:hypothetical protein
VLAAKSAFRGTQNGTQSFPAAAPCQLISCAEIHALRLLIRADARIRRQAKTTELGKGYGGLFRRPNWAREQKIEFGKLNFYRILLMIAIFRVQILDFFAELSYRHCFIFSVVMP